MQKRNPTFQATDRSRKPAPCPNPLARFGKTRPGLRPGEVAVPPRGVRAWKEKVRRGRGEWLSKIPVAAQNRNRLDFQWISVKGDPVGTTLLYSRYADLAVASQS